MIGFNKQIIYLACSFQKKEKQSKRSTNESIHKRNAYMEQNGRNDSKYLLHYTRQFCDETVEIMLLRSTVARREHTHSQIDELITRLTNKNTIAQDKEMAVLLTKRLGEIFSDLHLYLSEKNICQLKAFQNLSDGVYVLLKGQVSYMFSSGGQPGVAGGGTSATLLTKPWTVFQSAFKNCATIEEAWLLKIGEEELEASHFRTAFERRKTLYQGQYLSQDHYSVVTADEQKPVKVDLHIHNNFSFVNYTFRQIIAFDSPAILSQGRAKLKSSLVRSHEFDRFGVMLPGLRYEITSSQAEVMVIANNQTLRCFYRFLPTRGNLVIASHCRTEAVTPGGDNQKYKDRRYRQLGKLFKDAQNYSILSGFLCEKSLEFAKKHNEKHCTKQKREGRYRNPLVLFSLTTQKSKIALPSFQDLNSTLQHPHSSSLNKTTSNHSNILKKLKLPQADHDRFFARSNKNKTQTLYSKLAKVSRQNLNLTFDRVEPDLRDFQDDEFTPYNQVD